MHTHLPTNAVRAEDAALLRPGAVVCLSHLRRVARDRVRWRTLAWELWRDRAPPLAPDWPPARWGLLGSEPCGQGAREREALGVWRVAAVDGHHVRLAFLGSWRPGGSTDGDAEHLRYVLGSLLRHDDAEKACLTSTR